ncbi:hypothetical protein FACS1894139_15990 [Planctomycetales bacterium]|nr:hypothetical protein FACS1894107_13360 [Planctomycetales bacterium]GHT00431.1 hypothetical protein FACS1894108_12470 [Planctomycetales bacterium]GHT07530.1 hypothetical protein FACS1894139_15990 [Planctomycetales bacterium]
MSIVNLVTIFIPVKRWRRGARNSLRRLITIKEIMGKCRDYFAGPAEKIRRLTDIGDDALPRLQELSRKDYRYCQKGYGARIALIREKARRGEKIRVCFLVNFAAAFAARPVFEKMLGDSFFDPFILVSPFVNTYEKADEIKEYEKTYAELSTAYKNVFRAYDASTTGGQYVDFMDRMDIAFIPTNDQTREPIMYRIYNFVKHGVPTLMVYYGYRTLAAEMFFTDTTALLWKLFTENKISDRELRDGGLDNTVLSGCPNVDKMAAAKPVPRNRKKIIIAPHHSITGIGLDSQFLKYADLFVELPRLYPDIDFVFRPHPLLKNALYHHPLWGREKTDKYFEKLLLASNIVFDDNGEYFDLFLNSDAIIHDCGSFLPEYLFSEHPAAYMADSAKNIYRNRNDFSKMCLDHYYQCFAREDIINFIDKVVVGGIDSMKDKRAAFVDSSLLKINYPHISEFIVCFVKKAIVASE